MLNTFYFCFEDTSSEEEDSTEKELVRKISCLQKENKQLKSKDKKRKRTIEDMLNGSRWLLLYMGDVMFNLSI